MPWDRVTPVFLDCNPGELCRRRYPGHPRGCPNYGKRDTCPPRAARWSAEMFAGKEVYAVWNQFDFGAHVAKMRARHPPWTERQLANCLYWQGTARAQLTKQIAAFRCEWDGSISVHRIPEAHGVNVTATMRQLGIELKWPPREWAFQVALAIVDAAAHSGTRISDATTNRAGDHRRAPDG